MYYFAKRGITRGVYLDIGCFHRDGYQTLIFFIKRVGKDMRLISTNLNELCELREAKSANPLGAVFAGSGANTTGTVYKFRRIWSDIDTLDKQR